MVGRPPAGHLQSPLEIVLIPVAIGVLAGVGLLWGTGVVIGSILGSSLPGSAGESVVKMLSAFPDIGVTWEPTIPSLLIWVVAATVVAALAPLVWKLVRIGRLKEEGAQWATSHDLRRAGLLVADPPMALAVAEAPNAADEG